MICLNENQIGGFIIFHKHFFGNLFIDLVIGSPRMRKRGIAKRLIKYVENKCNTKIFPSTNHSNEVMKEVFNNVGYIQSGQIDNLDEGSGNYLFLKK